MNARDACLNWLAERECSRAELADRLKAKGCDSGQIEDILNALAEEGWQSDRRFVENYVRSRLEKGQGPQKIRQELSVRGMKGQELSEFMSAVNWDAALVRLYRKKFGDAPPACPREYAARVRFLIQRGFEQDRIQAFFRRLNWDEN